MYKESLLSSEQFLLNKLDGFLESESGRTSRCTPTSFIECWMLRMFIHGYSWKITLNKKATGITNCLDLSPDSRFLSQLFSGHGFPAVLFPYLSMYSKILVRAATNGLNLRTIPCSEIVLHIHQHLWDIQFFPNHVSIAGSARRY